MARNNLTIAHHGNHHTLNASVDTKTKEIKSFATVNFSDNSMLELKQERGRTTGAFRHVGASHMLDVKLNNDGTISGNYIDKNLDGCEISIGAGLASLKHGTLKTANVKFTGTHHEASLAYKNGNINGSLKAKLDKHNSMGLKFKDGVLSGSFVHKGDNHSTKITIQNNKWSGEVMYGTGKAKIGFKVDCENGINIKDAKMNLMINL